MGQVFANQGIAFTSGWDNFTSAQTAKELTALAQTGANSVSLVGRAYQTSLTTSSIDPFSRTTDMNVLGNLIDQSHGLGLSVTLTPHLDVTDVSARSGIAPTDVATWFKNYTALMVSYATLAQAHGVEMLSIGTEMDGVTTPANAGYWNALIDAVRHVYSGKLTYQADYFAANDVTFWNKLDVISIDGYVPVATNTTPTVDSVVAAWSTAPTDLWLAQKLDYKAPLDFLRDLSLKYGKPLEFGELGYRNGDGAGIHPGDWKTVLAPDAAEQKVLYDGFFKVFSKETSWFEGVNLWEWSSTAVAPTATTTYDLETSPALPLITQWYSGAHNGQADRTLTGTNSNDILLGGSGRDVILGGAGSDILRGGAGDDRLSGDEGIVALSNKFVVYATGTPAGGINPLMQVSVNGAVIATVSVPKNADGSSSVFTFDLPPGVLVKNVSVAFTNDAIIGTEDRNLYLQKFIVNGVTLNPADSVNTRVPGTYTLWSIGSISFDLSKHPEISTPAVGGADTLDGGAGNDVLTGGVGDDIFVFARGSGTDVITDFGQSGDHDRIDISDYLSHGLTPALRAIGGDVELRFTTGEVIILQNVKLTELVATDTGYTMSPAQIVVPDPVPVVPQPLVTSVSYTLAAGQVVESLTLDQATGTAALNLTGNAFNNRLIGNAGNNVLDGGAGADTMIGGRGDDTYMVDNPDDVVIEAIGGGMDRVVTSVNYTLGRGQEIEILKASDRTATTALVLTGNEFANTITGNAGNNVLDGGAGADIMIGGLGDDTYIVDNVGDVVTEAVGGGYDTVVTNVSYVLAAGQEIERLQAAASSTPAPLNLTGNEFANYLLGNGGNNILDGGAGADTMVGGLGDDTYMVDNPGDVVIEAVGGGMDRVVTSVSYTLGVGQEIEILKAADRLAMTALVLTGNEFANTITGNAGNNVLDGGTGADTMIGGLGDDTYVVDNVGDVVTEAKGGGYDTVVSLVSYTLGAGQEIEKLQLAQSTGSTALNLTGNEFDNYLQGNAGHNVLDGGAGNDTLVGGLGADDLRGGAGADIFLYRDGDLGATVDTTDHILDFSHAQGDKIDFSRMDGNTNLAGRQSFSLHDSGADHVAGAVWLVQTGNDTIVNVDTDGDGKVDYVLHVTSQSPAPLVASDFLF